MAALGLLAVVGVLGTVVGGLLKLLGVKFTPKCYNPYVPNRDDNRYCTKTTRKNE